MKLVKKTNIFVLGNNDYTTNIIMSPLFDNPSIRIVGCADTVTLTSGAGGLFSQALKLLRKMNFSYWLFLVFFNFFPKIRGFFRRFSHLDRTRGEYDSVANICSRKGLPYLKVSNINSREFKDHLRNLDVDLLIIRINQILDKEILSIPRQGTWCVHSSLLPAYGGFTAEFHALRHNEPWIGTTIFEVNTDLDGGAPLFQMSFPSSTSRSLFTHILTNNILAGEVLSEAVEEVARMGKIHPHVFSPPPEKSYFRWPLSTHIKQFASQGYRIISLQEALHFILYGLLLAETPKQAEVAVKKGDVPTSDT